MKNKYTKFIRIIFILLLLFSLASCGGDSGGADLSSILKNYRSTGLSSWWEVLAVYNAGENPIDYKGFEELYLSLEGTSNLKMASYVIVADIAVIIGADEGYFEKYAEYKLNLKNLLENPSSQYTLNDYIFSYYALKCSGMNFNYEPFGAYLLQSQKADGGFALSGDSGDTDVTALAIPALKLLYETSGFDDIESLINAVEFLRNTMGENGAFISSFDGGENANSTACALSAFIAWYKDPEDSDGAIEKAAGGLALFTAGKETGYAHLKGGKSDILATAQAAVALGDLKNKTSVWDKLYLDSVAAFEPEE